MDQQEVDVRIPDGGFKPGFFYNDFTQFMTPEDAKLVREHLFFFTRSSPGIFFVAIMGILIGISLSGG